MPATFDEAAVDTVKHYLQRCINILHKLRDLHDSQQHLDAKLAPDMFETGFNLAISIQFAARALCPPAGLEVPEIPQRFTCATLLDYAEHIGHQIKGIRVADLTRDVSHSAGQAVLEQNPADYISRFAIPNMIFHLSLAYAALRSRGMPLGKSDFDGLHVY